MRDRENDNNELYVCIACDLHYESKEMMKKCYAYCAQYKGCNLEITEQSIENQNRRKLANN